MLLRSAVLLASLTAATLLSACVTTSSTPYPQAYHTQAIQTWVGRDTIELWASWGPPARTSKAANGYEYQIYEQRIPKPAGVSDPALDTVYAQSSDPGCVTYFIVDPKTTKVRAAHWRGRTCPVAQPAGRVAITRGAPQPTGF